VGSWFISQTQEHKKSASYASAHITETVFAHDQHWEEQSTLSSPQLYRHSHSTYYMECILVSLLKHQIFQTSIFETNKFHHGGPEAIAPVVSLNLALLVFIT